MASRGQRGYGHVHIHMLMPAGGLTYGEKRLWAPFPASATFLSEEVLGAEFRDQLLKALEKMHASGAFEPSGPWSFLASYAAFDQWLSPLREIDWVVRHRHVWRSEGVETGRPSEKVVEYLARYATAAPSCPSPIQPEPSIHLCFGTPHSRQDDHARCMPVSRWARVCTLHAGSARGLESGSGPAC